MRVISLLVVVILIMFILYKQIDGVSKTEAMSEPKSYGVDVPEAPRNPQDVQALKDRVNVIMQDAAEKMDGKIEGTTGE